MLSWRWSTVVTSPCVLHVAGGGHGVSGSLTVSCGGRLVFWGIGVSALIAVKVGGWGGCRCCLAVLRCGAGPGLGTGALVPRNAHSGWFLVVPPHGVGWPTSRCPVQVD